MRWLKLLQEGITLQVRYDHALVGRKHSAKCCPVALALDELLEDKSWAACSFDVEGRRVIRVRSVKPGEVDLELEAHLSPELSARLDTWENTEQPLGEHIETLTFHLTAGGADRFRGALRSTLLELVPRLGGLAAAAGMELAPGNIELLDTQSPATPGLETLQELELWHRALGRLLNLETI